MAGEHPGLHRRQHDARRPLEAARPRPRRLPRSPTAATCGGTGYATRDTRRASAFTQMLAGDALAGRASVPRRDCRGPRGQGHRRLTEHGPVLLVAAPVLDGAGNGPHRGSVLLGRSSRPTWPRGWADQAQVQLDAHGRCGPRRRGRSGEPPRQDQPRSVRPRTSCRSTVSRQLADIGGVPAFMLRIDVPRSVSARGRAAIGFALLSLLVAGLVVLFVLLAALRVHGAAAGEPHDAPRGRDRRGRRPDATPRAPAARTSSACWRASSTAWWTGSRTPAAGWWTSRSRPAPRRWRAACCTTSATR